MKFVDRQLEMFDAKRDDEAYCRPRLLDVCRTESSNVVWAHSDRAEHSKGSGLKTDDQWRECAYLWCHCVYDGQHSSLAGITFEFVKTEFASVMNESRAAFARKRRLPAPIQGTEDGHAYAAC